MNLFKTNHKNIKISTKEKINFLESFSSLLNSGIPITNALKIIEYQTKSKKTKILINKILQNINSGIKLEESFLQFPKIFNNFDVSLIKMGEITGKLGDTIETIKNKEEKSRELKSKVIGALVYPMIIMSLTTIMIGIFMVFVIPKITDMYKDAKVNLPDLTQSVINISNFLQEKYYLIILGFIIFIFLIKIFKTHKKTKIYCDKAVLHIPIFGGLIRKKILSLFASSMGTLLTQGVMINDALKITSGALENDYYQKEILRITYAISSGKVLSEEMGINLISSGKKSPYFPIELSSIIKIGEQTGKMPSLLSKIRYKI
ncbi:MAG: type II secretion system F family protein [Candidatus Gracilibacteria bacterium]|nr:type II secretion system F family protein [Candidatus Gracilibacteria bacterium]